MAKTKFEKKLFKRLRAMGLRKRTARTITKSMGKNPGRRMRKSARRSTKTLRAALGDLGHRAPGKAGK